MDENHTIASLLKTNSDLAIKQLLAHYSALKLSENELVTCLQLIEHADVKQNVVTKIAAVMHQNESFVFSQLHNLTAKKLLTITQALDADNKQTDVYSLTPLYKQLAAAISTPKQTAQPQKDETAAARQALFAKIEQELGQLSPINYQKVQDWLGVDHYSPEMIELALQEAVLNNVRSFNYVDRILLSWEHQGLTTAKKIIAYQNNVRQKQIRDQKAKQPLAPSDNADEIPVDFKWK